MDEKIYIYENEGFRFENVYLRREGHSLDTYNRELFAMKFIEEGKPDELAEMLKPVTSLEAVNLSANRLRQHRYVFVISATLATRTAIAAGLDSDGAYTLSDWYIQKMDAMTELDGIAELLKQMLVGFASKVREAAKKIRFSTPVSRAVKYISNNLHQKMQLADIASFAGVSADYLSKRFLQETGVSVTGHILRTKIEEAKDSLKFGDKSIHEISYSLSFCSQSYFGKVFKELTGLTPKQYRQTYRKNF